VRLDPITTIAAAGAVLLIVSVPPEVIAAALLLLLLAALAIAVWRDVAPLWRGEPLSPDQESE
jgi:hypothetical protein